MKWPGMETIATLTQLPDGYRFEQLRRSDIPALIEGIRTWHPDISVGVGSCYLRESFYTEKVFLRDEAEKEMYVVLIMHGDEMAGMGSWEREPDALTLYARLGIIAPAHRGAKIAVRDEELLRPDPRNLTPRARALFEVLFPD